MTLLTDSPKSLVAHLSGIGWELPELGLVDIGVSGGLNPAWRHWKSKLFAIGVDAIEDEVARLTEIEPNRNVRYIAARVGLPQGAEQIAATRSNYSLHRSLAYLATAAFANKTSDFSTLWRGTVGMADPPVEANYSNISDPMRDCFFGHHARRFAGERTPRMTNRTATVDEIVAELGMPRVDMLKVDTDGFDFDTLRGSVHTLESCLAVEVETQFHGPISRTANVFCNIDSFMREHGFSLFKLAPVSYSRSALPRPFVYDIAAQNHAGQVMWADALYIREGVHEADRRRNLALILDVYGLEDAAAEVIMETPHLFDVSALDFLARKVHGDDVTHDRLTRAFMADPVGFHTKLDSR